MSIRNEEVPQYIGAILEAESRNDMFTKEEDPTDFSMLEHVPEMVSMDENMVLCRYPTMDEVKAAAFDLSGDSASGPDGFTGRRIYENILLTQEIVTDIRMIGKPANVVLKLDMTKAYDRDFWKYVMHVLRKMVFAEHFIIIVGNLLANNWYLVLVNEHSSDKSFVGFGMPKWSNPLNHLAYADDTIIFASANPYSMKKIMTVLGSYEQISG
nr:uncharacterized protein LOC104111339 [Nicotiana tomentosiformis]